MSNILKDKKKLFNLFTECLYISFVLSYLFNTTFKVSIWNNEIIESYFRFAFNNVMLLKDFIIIPLLFVTEFIVLVYKIKNKENIIRQSCNTLLFCLIYLLTKKYTYYTCYWGFHQALLLIYFAKYLDFDKIVYLYAGSMTISALFNIWGCMRGYLSIDGPGRGLVCGFSHSNQAAMFYSMLFLGISYCLKKNKILITLISIPFIYLNSSIFESRTAYIVLLMFVLLLWLEPLYNKIKGYKFVKIVYILFPIIMTLLAIYLGIKIYNGSLIIDKRAATRFKEIVMVYKESGFAFGYRDLSSSYYFDNGYAKLIFRHGLFISGLIYSIWILNGNKVIKDSNYLVMIINVSLFIYMMMEYIFVNDLIFVMMTYLVSKNKNFLNVT